MTDRFRVLIADQIDRDGLLPLSEDQRFELDQQTGLDQPQLAEALTNYDAVLVRSATTISREALAKTSRLKVIGRAGVGVDTIDIDAATERGIAVLNAPAGNTTSAAELAFALLLALARRIPSADRSMKAGKWDRKALGGVELFGKTLGLVGAGRVGGEVAARARAFGMTVLIYDPYLQEERAEQLGATLLPLEDLLPRADIISLHVPLTEATAGLLNPQRLALLKPGVLLINAARGGIVDEGALIEALRSGRVAGAALDVFGEEPLPADHPFRSLDNAILTPHLGASTAEAQRNVAREIADAVRSALTEGDLSRAVNAPAIGGEQFRRLRPLLDLADRLGQVARALAGGPIKRAELRYSGDQDDALRPLSAAAMIGLLTGVLGRQAVNFVNALHLTKVRGIDLTRVRTARDADYGENLELLVGGTGYEVRLVGNLLGEGHSRLVRIDDYHVDVVPRETLVILRNRDVPGVIGRVGTLLGGAGVNIAEYHQARHDEGGDALAAIRVDSKLDPGVMASLAALPDVASVKQVELLP